MSNRSRHLRSRTLQRKKPLNYWCELPHLNKNMASEFYEFLAAIGRVIVWILKMTLSLIATVFLIASFAAVWRIPWIFAEMLDEVDSHWEYQGACLLEFFASVFDYMTLIPFLIGFLCPTRTYHLRYENPFSLFVFFVVCLFCAVLF